MPSLNKRVPPSLQAEKTKSNPAWTFERFAQACRKLFEHVQTSLARTLRTPPSVQRLSATRSNPINQCSPLVWRKRLADFQSAVEIFPLCCAAHMAGCSCRVKTLFPLFISAALLPFPAKRLLIFIDSRFTYVWTSRLRVGGVWGTAFSTRNIATFTLSKSFLQKRDWCVELTFTMFLFLRQAFWVNSVRKSNVNSVRSPEAFVNSSGVFLEHFWRYSNKKHKTSAEEKTHN